MTSIIEFISGLELTPTINCSDSSLLTFLIRSRNAIASNSFRLSALSGEKIGGQNPNFLFRTTACAK